MDDSGISIEPVGFIHSEITSRDAAPRQGYEGAPDAWIEVKAALAAALEGLMPGSEVIVITWLHQARRDVLQVHPRGDKSRPLTGVFGTRSPDRPNPLGLHRVTVKEIAANRLKVGPLEALDGTPVLDIKTVLSRSADS